jgi:hypothetical protein
MSASEDVSHNAAGPSGFSLYVFRDIRALLPSRTLGSRSALRDDDYAEARRYARTAMLKISSAGGSVCMPVWITGSP